MAKTIDKVLNDAPEEVAAPKAAPQPELEQMPLMQMTPTLFAQAAQRTLQAAEKRRMAAIDRLRKEETVNVAIPPSYRKYFGKVMYNGLIGASVHIPVNGKHYPVPKSFAAIIRGKMRMHDAYEMRKARMADVQNNFEDYAGALKF